MLILRNKKVNNIPGGRKITNTTTKLGNGYEENNKHTTTKQVGKNGYSISSSSSSSSSYTS